MSSVAKRDPQVVLTSDVSGAWGCGAYTSTGLWARIIPLRQEAILLGQIKIWHSVASPSCKVNHALEEDLAWLNSMAGMQ